ncbi:MAG: hypothetical protein ACR2MS_06710 [Weeksellaceae bacterium]
MKTKIFLFSLLALWLFTAGSCNDDDDNGDRLPPITQTGANTAGYKLDGKVILPRQEISWVYGPSYGKGPLQGNLNDKVLELSIFNYLKISNPPIKGISKELIININVHNDSISFHLDKGTYGNMVPEYSKYSMIEGNLNFLKKDENSGIYAGTFNAKLKEEKTGEILNITDGRFDINLNTLNKD